MHRLQWQPQVLRPSVGTRLQIPARTFNTFIDTGGDAVFTFRPPRPDTAERLAWTPPSPNYTSTYREGFNVAGPVRLVIQLDLEYKQQ